MELKNEWEYLDYQIYLMEKSRRMDDVHSQVRKMIEISLATQALKIKKDLLEMKYAVIEENSDGHNAIHAVSVEDITDYFTNKRGGNV